MIDACSVFCTDPWQIWPSESRCARNVTQLAMLDQVGDTHMSILSLATLYVTRCEHANTYCTHTKSADQRVQNTLISYKYILIIPFHMHIFTWIWNGFYLFHTMTIYSTHSTVQSLEQISNAVSNGMCKSSKMWLFFSLPYGQKWLSSWHVTAVYLCMYLQMSPSWVQYDVQKWHISNAYMHFDLHSTWM